MSTRRGRIALVLPVMVSVLVVEGCRGAEKAALPVAPVSADPVTADPLAGIESAVDAVERDIDGDVRPDPGR